MSKIKVAFDVDDTLIIPRVAHQGDYEIPNYETIALLHWFQAQGHHVIVWSGSGEDWARTWCEKFGIFPDEIYSKQDPNRPTDVDIAFDDCEVDLATVNVKVGRLNNHISRAVWNKEKR